MRCRRSRAMRRNGIRPPARSRCPIELDQLETSAAAEPVPIAATPCRCRPATCEDSSEAASPADASEADHHAGDSTEGGGSITEVNGQGGEEEVIESVGGSDAMEEVPERAPTAAPAIQDSRSHQAPPGHAGAGGQGGTRHQGRGAHHLSLARRPLFGADAEHRARRRDQPQDHQPRKIAASSRRSRRNSKSRKAWA